MRRLLALVVVLGLVLTGCSTGSSEVAEDMDDMEGMEMPDAHAHGENAPVVADAREIAIRAEGLRFTPDRVEIAAGEEVTIVFTSADIGHDFTIAELDVHVGADAGKTEKGGLRVDRPGEYTFVCTVAGHESAGMTGTLVVTET